MDPAKSLGFKKKIYNLFTCFQNKAHASQAEILLAESIAAFVHRGQQINKK